MTKTGVPHHQKKNAPLRAMEGYYRALSALPLGRAPAINLIERRGIPLREAARRVGRSPSAVHLWREALIRKLLERERWRHDIHHADASVVLSESDRDRDRAALTFGDAEHASVVSALDEARWHARFHPSVVRWQRTQPREEGSKKGPNRKARQILRRRLESIHDTVYVGDERNRRALKAQFVHIVLRAACAPDASRLAKQQRITLEAAFKKLGVQKLDLDDLQTSAESRAVRETRKEPEPVEVNLGRALREGVPQLKDRIWQRIRERTAQVFGSAEVTDVNRFTTETDDGRKLRELRSGEFRDGEWVSYFFVPTDTARKDPVLSEKCRCLGVSLELT